MQSIFRHTVKPPLDERALDRVETTLKKRDVAAFILEPIVCNLGGLVPQEAFMRGLAELCKRYGTLLVFDEVACGFGRTGKLFATEHYDVEPDILCLAKAITGGVVPMGATLMTDAVADALEDFGFYSTYGWHPRAVAVALANLRFWKRHGRPLLHHVNERGEQLRAGLRDLGEARGRGLAVGLEIDDAEAIEERCREAGLLVSADEDLLMIFPALTIDAETIDEGLAILHDSV